MIALIGLLLRLSGRGRAQEEHVGKGLDILLGSELFFKAKDEDDDESVAAVLILFLSD